MLLQYIPKGLFSSKDFPARTLVEVYGVGNLYVV